ncbi:hypothetical protein GCM10017782_14520 [Deinococcus ficus]|nr:hypothetical protein GCM10017782_14520 [Deinococcus ficus]
MKGRVRALGYGGGVEAPQRQIDANQRRQRGALMVLALLALLVQILTRLYVDRDPAATFVSVPAMVAFGLNGLLVVLAGWPRLPIHHVQRGAVGLVTLWLLLNVAVVAQTQRPITSGLLLHAVIVFLLAFSWLPLRWATVLVGVTYGLLFAGAMQSTVPDVPGLILTGFTIPLAWHLTLHGQEVSTERVRSAALAAIAATDPLTGLCNRRSGEAQLAALAGQWQAAPERLAVILFDLDHFKQINDSLGHRRGDEVLVAVAALLRDLTRPSDVLVRWGGEEFLVALADLSPADAREVGQRVLTVVRTVLPPGIPPVTLSAGLACLSEAAGVAGLVDLADRRLYEAKAAGRNRMVAGP